MGYSFKGICHTTKLDAATAFCESLTSSVLSTAGYLTTSSCVAVAADVTNVSVKVIDRNTTTTQILQVPDFLPCNHDGGIDFAMDYFYLGLGFLIVIWAAKQLQRIFQGHVDHA